MAKILIIDDEVDMCWAISNVLQGEGHSTVSANDGPEGLRMLDEERPDLVLLDIRLPGMDGTEILKKIKYWAFGPIEKPGDVTEVEYPFVFTQ